MRRSSPSRARPVVGRLEHHGRREVRDLAQPPGPVRGDRRVAGGRHDPFVGGEQVVGVRVEVGDPADHRGPGDEVVAVGQQVGEQAGVARVALDEPEPRMAVVAVRHRAVLRVVVEPHHRVPAAEQLLDHVPADEARRSGDQHLRHAAVPSRSRISGSAGRLARFPPGRELLGGQPAAEREEVPAQVAGQEPADVEPRLAELPVQPDRRDLGDRAAQPGRLRGQLDPDLEAGPRLDAHLPHEVGVVGLEAVGRVAGADPGESVQAAAGPPGGDPLEARPADLLAAGHVAGRGGDHHAAVDQPGQVVDLPRVVAAVGHRDHGDRRPGRVDAEPDRVGRAGPVRVEHGPHPRVAAARSPGRTGRWCPPACRAR